jgi:hypothetical protein
MRLDDGMHWTYRRGKHWWFQAATLGLQAIGMGLQAANAPKDKDPRRTEQEEHIKRVDDQFTRIRMARESDQNKGIHGNVMKTLGTIDDSFKAQTPSGKAALAKSQGGTATDAPVISTDDVAPAPSPDDEEQK